MYRKIIAAVDGSFHSELASGYAVAIAASCNSELGVLAIDTGEVGHEILSAAVERICQYAEDRGVKASGIVRKGEAVKIILTAIYMQRTPTFWSLPPARATIDGSCEALHRSSCKERPAPCLQ